MSPSLFIFFFLLYSFIGWVLDTASRSVRARRFAVGDGFPLPRWVPIAPIYGIGALLILWLRYSIASFHLVIQFLILTILLTAFEYVSAVISEKLTGKKLWDYSHQAFHFQGRISLFHALIWGALGLLLLQVIHPFFLTLLSTSIR